MNSELILQLAAISVISSAFIASFGFFEEWGKIPTGEPLPRGQTGYAPRRWKTWREWTVGDFLVSPIMLWGYLGMGVFGIAAAIIFAVTYILALNPIAVSFWTAVGNILNMSFTKNQ